MEKTIYLTLWYYSKYRSFWVVTGGTDRNPVQPIYEGHSKEALRFFKYAHFVKDSCYRFYESGINPNKGEEQPYQVDREYLEKLGVLVYVDNKPTTVIAKKKAKPLVEVLRELEINQKSILITDLQGIYSAVDIKVALHRLKDQLIREGDVISWKS